MSVNEVKCNDSFPLTQNRKEHVLTFTGIAGLVSACIFTLTISFIIDLRLYKRSVYRKGLYQLVFSQFLLYSYILTVAVGTYNKLWYHEVCLLTSVLLTYCFLTNILFTNVLVAHFFSLGVCRKQLHVKCFEFIYVLSSVVIPLFFT